MKAQSKRASLIETMTNIGVGIGLSFVANQIILVHFYGYNMSLHTNAIITFWFTVLAIARSYLLRRMFNYFTERSIRKFRNSVCSDVYLMTGERLPARETEAISHLTGGCK